jgi:Ca2+/Na+ antiporter
VWTFVASISIVAAIGFLLFAAFVAITQRYDAVTAGLALGGFFFVIAIIAVTACLTTRRHNIERARLELASRSSADLFDPSLLALGLQIGRAIGWQRLASFAAAGVLAAGLAREWTSRDQAPKSDPQN